MTKIQKSKKTIASLLAGILLCQVSAFGVSQTSVNAENPARKMSFEVVGEGSVTVTDVEDCIRTVQSGSEITVPDGMCIRVQSDAEEDTRISMKILDEEGRYELEDTSVTEGKSYWRDITAMGMNKKVVITFGNGAERSGVYSRRMVQARGNQQKPEVGDVFTGNCVVTAVNGGNGHTVHGVTMGGFTGILAGVTANGGCADHTAAAPYTGQECTYKYTITAVNKATGEVTGNLYCTSVTGATDGVTKDSSGRLIGYQRVSGTAVIHRSYNGYAKLKKGKTLTTLTDGNAEYSLEGAAYGVYSDRGATKENAVFTTDKNGESNTLELEEGMYYVKEKKAPKGYKLDERIYPVTVTSGQTVEVNVKDVPVYSDMELLLDKIDQESKEGKALGGGSLEGAEFTVRFYAGRYTQESLPEKPSKVWVLRTKKENNVCRSKLGKEYQISGDDFYYAENGDKPVLPLGTVSIEETKSPKGYMLEQAYIEGDNGKLAENYYLTQIVQNGNQTNIQGGNNYKIADRICRGDIEFQKKDEETQMAMAGIPFQITSVTTGECHRIMTDENGYFSSASDYTKHSKDTNSGQSESGVWFGTNSNGESVEVNDAYGAFPYDTYRLEELRCEENVDKVLYKGTFRISRDRYVVDLGTILNPDLTIATSAKDEATGTHYSNADEKVTIIDTITYTGLKKGQEYVMKGTLMDRETGEMILDGENRNITASKRFKPKTAEGSVEVKFEFDAKSLAGKSITIFEECMLDNTVIAVHKDLEDADQMIHFPKLKTSVKDEVTDMKMVKAEKDMRIIDTVEYHNLKKGKKYKITGTLMDKETGKAARSASGRKITESVEFVAEGKDGTAEVEFVFDGSNLAGKTLVAFEKLYYGEKLYAVHTDLEDEDQTIHVPSAGTTASDKNTGTHHAYAGEYVELTDTIEYRNLLPGETYTLHGTVVEKETEQRLSEEKQQEFIPEKADGSIEIAFEINGTDLSGKTAVIYEEIKIDGKSIAEHKDPEAKEQSIYFPKIGTKAMDKKSKTQEGDAREKQTIIDQVSYENLLPGETYILKGVLMDKADGKEMTDKNNRKITGRTTFTPEKSAGTVEMTFELDARELGGKAVVVFENLYDEEDHLIADEANIDNADQTIMYKNNEKSAVSPKINTDNLKPSSSIRKSPKTGVENHTFLWMLTLGSLGTAVAGGIAIYRKKRD